MKDLEQYIGAEYRNIFHPAIMTNILLNFLDSDIPTIITNTGV